MALTRNQTRKVYSFKSSGLKETDPLRLEREELPEKLPIGIATPISVSDGDGLFVMHRDLGKTVTDNCLLYTSPSPRD